jgi:hypothetical protein
MRVPQVEQAGRIKRPGGLTMIVAMLTPTNNEQTRRTCPVVSIEKQNLRTCTYPNGLVTDLFGYQNSIAKLDLDQTLSRGRLV